MLLVQKHVSRLRNNADQFKMRSTKTYSFGKNSTLDCETCGFGSLGRFKYKKQEYAII